MAIPAWKRALGCYNGWTGWCGHSYDHQTLSGHWRYVLRDNWGKLRDWPRDFIRWTLPGWLCWLACKCRGQAWYGPDVWHGVPGNRASELQQQIWQECVLYAVPVTEETQRLLESVEPKLHELATLAGECWGHIYPKNQQKG